MGINRIREAREAAGLTLAQLAERAGTSFQQLSKLEKGERRLTVDWMRRLGKALGVPAGSLICEDVHIASEHIAAGPPDLPPDPAEPIEYRGETYYPLPLYDVNVSAGPGAINVDQPEPEAWSLFRRDWLRAITRASLDHLAMVRVSGESMAPTLQNGDRVLVDRSVRSVGRDGLYVLAADHDVQVKRVSRDPRDRSLTIASENPAYPTWTGVSEENVAILGRVVWLGRNLGG